MAKRSNVAQLQFWKSWKSTSQKTLQSHDAISKLLPIETAKGNYSRWKNEAETHSCCHLFCNKDMSKHGPVFFLLWLLLSVCVSVCILQVPVVAIAGSGGGFRAMVGFSGVMKALFESGVLDCATYIAGLSGSTWSVFISPPLRFLYTLPLSDLFLKTPFHFYTFFSTATFLSRFIFLIFLGVAPPCSGKLSCLPLLVWSLQAGTSGLFLSPRLSGFNFLTSKVPA